jgi:cystathionine beta-synthase
MIKAYETIIDTIGHTPLVKLNLITSKLKANIYAKIEFFNPGGSVKDRIARHMVEAAEKQGLLNRGGTIIEATAGNTGTGLAIIAAIKGYRCIFIMPDKMSEDKINLLKAFGAEVLITPTSVPPDSAESYNSVAERLSKEIRGAFRPDQFNNHNNPLAHYATTGPEIWEDSRGETDVFVAGMGTGGTISGVGKYLKEKKSEILVVGADPEGSILSGDVPHSYMVEGIGEDFIPKTFNRQVIDEMIRISDKESFHIARRLACEEDILVGGSSGTAAAAALQYAERIDESKNIVVLFPDTGRNYISRIFSDQWLRENGYGEVKTSRTKIMKDVISKKKYLPQIISVSPEDTLQEAFSLMHRYNISQVPVMEENQSIGCLTESTLLNMVFDGLDITNKTTRSYMGKPLPELEEHTDAAAAYRILLTGSSALMVTRKGIPAAVITRIDLIDHYAQRREK